MPPTMKDIAKAAGVSQPAVSAVLNNRGNCRVSPETRSRILRIAEELDYHPNQAARLLRGHFQSILFEYLQMLGKMLI